MFVFRFKLEVFALGKMNQNGAETGFGIDGMCVCVRACERVLMNYGNTPPSDGRATLGSETSYVATFVAVPTRH